MMRFPSLFVKISPEGVNIFSLMLSSILPDRLMPVPVSLFIFRALSGVRLRVAFALLDSAGISIDEVVIGRLMELIDASLTGFLAAVKKYLPPG